MKYLITLLLIALTSIAPFHAHGAESPIQQKEPVPAINTKEDFAVRGYDPVSYFTSGKPEVGSPLFVYEWRGVRWRFVSSDHRDVFKTDPERYAPQFGGYCAMAMSLGRIADGDPEQWAVVDGKLFLNNNARAQALWNEDRAGNISQADKNWPL